MGYIVSVVCSSGSPEPEVLMKAKEISHNIKLLLGGTQARRGALDEHCGSNKH